MIATRSPIWDLVEERMKAAPANRHAWPLGYPTWTADEVVAALECLCDQRTTMWEKCEEFERQFGEYLRVRTPVSQLAPDTIMVNSGSSADLIMMLAARELGMLKPGDEILIPAVTWPTQVWAAIEAGFKVKLVDVDIHTLNATPDILERAIGPKTKAIFLVHLMGNPCEITTITDLCRQRGLLLFEDCCEALGASFDGRKVGTFGIASSFSFFASHHISTMEGGAVATSNPDFAEACRLLRAHGWARDLKYRITDVDVFNRYGVVEDSRYLFLGMGFNFRPTEPQGAIGQVQLRKLDAMNEQRNRNAETVALRFRSTNGQTVESLTPDYRATPAWFALPFVLREGLPYGRKAVSEYLEQYGIDTRPIVGGNLARHPAFWKYGMGGNLPGADAIHDRGFYVGLPPVETSMDSLIGMLNSFDSNLRYRYDC